MYSCILAGGSGSRLWPLSSTRHPKQFLRLFGNKSLLQTCVARQLCLSSPERVLFVSPPQWHDQIIDQCRPLFACGPQHCIKEPSAQSTTAAIALAIRTLLQRGADIDDLLFVAAADHIIEPVKAFVASVHNASIAAERGKLVLFGVEPTYPATGYGYIHADESGSLDSVKSVKGFVEKPSRDLAEKFVDGRQHFWNSGLFFASLRTYCRELQTHAQTAFDLLNCPEDDVLDVFSSLRLESFDRAVIEKCSCLVMQPLILDWSDLGSFDSLFERQRQEKNASVADILSYGPSATIDCTDCFFYSDDERPIAAYGLSDLICISSKEGVLLLPKGQSERVRDLIKHVHKGSVRPDFGALTKLYKAKNSEVFALELKAEHSFLLHGIAHIHVLDGYLNVNGSIISQGQSIDTKDAVSIENNSHIAANAIISVFGDGDKAHLSLLQTDVRADQCSTARSVLDR